MTGPSPRSRTRAEELFDDWLRRRDAGEDVGLDAVCGAHPDLADDLRSLMAGYELLSHLLPGPLGEESLAERLKKKFGGDVDPAISLGDEPKPDPALSSALLEKLRAAAPRGTRYKLLGEIARGGMGVILRVWDDELRRTLAMKVVLAKGETKSGETPAVDPKTLGRFLEEAQITGQLDHPGIVSVHELGLGTDGRVYFTMRLVKGDSLRTIFDHVRDGTDGWNQVRALGVMLKVCEAMSYAHDKRVIHRDLKPSNVMVGKYGEVYVMDWGLARVLGREDRHDLRIKPAPSSTLSAVKTERDEQRDESPDSPIVTMDGDVVGTPSFMPPEQAKGQIGQVGPHSDVYSVGAMLYQLIGGEMPYVPADARLSQRMIVSRVIDGPPRPLHELAPRTPGELIAICERAMAREVPQRYADTRALADDLRAYLEHRVVRAYETGAWAEARMWVERNRPLAAALAAAIVLLVTGLATSLVFKARADEREKYAKEQERLAMQKANDVLSLTAIHYLKELKDRADALWPATPETVPKYKAWLRDARDLIKGREADPSSGIESKLSLAQHEARLAGIRQRAKPLTKEQIDADRRASPSYAEWEKSCAKLTWMRRMLEEEPWPTEAEVEAVLAIQTIPADAIGLNDMAWELVDFDPAKIAYGGEVRALLLARRAVAAAKEIAPAEFVDTLGWTLFRAGRVEAALAQEQKTVDEVQGNQKEALSASRKKRQEQVALWMGHVELSKRAEEAAQLGSRIAELEHATNERRTYEFEEAEDTVWHAMLANVVSDLREFTNEKTGGLFSSGVSETSGWGIVKRAAFAQTIGERSVEGPDARRLWSEAIAAITSSPKYGWLKLAPQLGLLPIGPDPDSGLWEFAHLQTGDPAVRGAYGRLTVTEATGLVFVLIPGGTFWMGAQTTDLNGRNYDPEARDVELPVHEVTLSPYFLSKYEMTQGQWLRIAGRNPSYYEPSTKINDHQHNLTHPVEQVMWTASMALMERLELQLPSEAQWEFGCRGGRDTPWWTGKERESLRGKVNLADQTAKDAGARWQDISDWPDLEDDWAFHAPVGSLAANPYGLHEVHGNVWEWCRDGYENYSAGKQVDPVTPWNGAEHRVSRGGCFIHAASHARSAHRTTDTPEAQSVVLGLRPARAISP